MSAHAKGAAAAIRQHVSQCGTKGNRKPKTVHQSSDVAAAQRVGGYAGGSFDNKSVGKQ